MRQRGIQRSLFFARERPGLSLGKITEGKRADGDPDEAEDIDVQRGEHATDVAISTLVKDDFKPAMLGAGAQERRSKRAEELALGANAAAESLQEIVGGDRTDLDMVGLLKMGSGIGDASRPLRIVREQQETFAGLIETADRRKPGEAGWEKSVDRLSALLVGGGRDNAAGLVQNQVHPGMGLDGRTAHGNAITRANGRLWVAAHGSVHRDRAAADEEGGLRARTVASFR